MRRTVLFCCSLLVLPAVCAQAQEKPLPILETGSHQGKLAGVYFLPGDQQALTVGRDRTLRFWDVGDGHLIKTLYLPAGPGSDGQPWASALSPDGKLLAVGGLGYADKNHRHFPVLLIDLIKECEHARLIGPTTPIWSLSFSGDGKRLAAASREDKAYVWEMGSSQAPHCLGWPKGATDGDLVRLSPDGKLLLYAGYSKGFKVLEVASGQVRFAFVQPKAHVYSVAWSPNGNILATAHLDGLRLWTPEGKLLRYLDQFRWVGDISDGLIFSPDSSHLWVQSTNLKGSNVLDVNSFEDRPFSTSPWWQAANSHDGKLILCDVPYRNVALLLSAVDGKIIHRLGMYESKWWATGWSQDNKKIAFVMNGERLRSFDLTQLAFGPALESQAIHSARHQWADLTLKYADRAQILKKGKIVARLPEKLYARSSFTFINQQQLAYSNLFGECLLFDIAKDAVIRRVPAHNADSTLSFTSDRPTPSGDDRYLLSVAGQRLPVCIWNAQQDQPLLFLRIFNQPDKQNSEGEWIAWTPEGFYAGTPAAEQKFGFLVRQGPGTLPKFLPAREFRKVLYRPDIIQRLLEFGSVKNAQEAANKARGVQTSFYEFSDLLPPKVALIRLSENVFKPHVRLEAKILQRGAHPVQSFQLLLNGRPYQGEKSIILPQLGNLPSWEIELSPGTHRLSVLVTTSVSATRSEEIELTLQAPKAVDLRPDLYVLSIGINHYPKNWALNFAARDAEGIAAIFKSKGQPTTYRTVQTKVLTDHAATKKGILEGFAWLRRSLQPSDVAIIFYAGHGMNDKEGRFYLLPVDADFNAVEKTSVSDEEIKKRLTDMPGRILLMFDACHSGATRARVDRLARDLSDDDCGVVVMCAATGREEAGEDSKIGHGYFALAVMEGLSGKADTSKKDGQVYLHHLDSYVYESVVEMSKDEQHPVVGRPTSVRTFALAKP